MIHQKTPEAGEGEKKKGRGEVTILQKGRRQKSQKSPEKSTAASLKRKSPQAGGGVETYNGPGHKNPMVWKNFPPLNPWKVARS